MNWAPNEESAELFRNMLRNNSVLLPFEAAARAPDHGTMRPWRVRVIRGDARKQLGGLMADTLRRKRPSATWYTNVVEHRDVAGICRVCGVSGPLLPHPRSDDLRVCLVAR